MSAILLTSKQRRFRRLQEEAGRRISDLRAAGHSCADCGNFIISKIPGLRMDAYCDAESDQGYAEAKPHEICAQWVRTASPKEE